MIYLTYIVWALFLGWALISTLAFVLLMKDDIENEISLTPGYVMGNLVLATFPMSMMLIMAWLAGRGTNVAWSKER